jgi:hypothetical protein
VSNATLAGIDETIDDVKYTFSPLTFEDYEWIELRMRARAIEAGSLSISEQASQSAKDERMRQVLEHAQSIDVFQNLQIFMSPIGVVWMLYLMCRRSKPELTLNEVGTWTKRQDLMNSLMPKLLALSGVKKNFPPAEKLPKGTRRKTPRGPKLRKA